MMRKEPFVWLDALDHLSNAIRTGFDEAERNRLADLIDDVKTHLLDQQSRDAELVRRVASDFGPGALPWWRQIFDTGLFYFAFGCVFIGVALWATEAGLNASLTFLIAILGVAVLLYGTGSQAVGSFGMDANKLSDLFSQVGAVLTPEERAIFIEQVKKENAKQDRNSGVNIIVAGGAAVLALIFGYGVIWKSPEIRNVFRDHDRYYKVKIQLCTPNAEGCLYNGPLPSSRGVGGMSAEELASNMERLLNGISLETTGGHVAYGRKISKSMVEFIILEREAGSDKGVRLAGGKVVAKGMANALISLELSDGSFNLDRPVEGDCMYKWNGECVARLNARDDRDQDRVRLYMVRAEVKMKTEDNTAITGAPVASSYDPS